MRTFVITLLIEIPLAEILIYSQCVVILKVLLLYDVYLFSVLFSAGNYRKGNTCASYSSLSLGRTHGHPKLKRVLANTQHHGLPL